MAQALNFIIDKCTGCHQCELACSGMKEGVFSVDRARIRIFQLQGFQGDTKNVPFACGQCAQAWCMHACPVGAIWEKDGTGAKILEDGRCIRCKVCTIACPYGTVTYQPASGKVVKCDLCEGDELGPACIGSCPSGAIELIDQPAD